ncbi:type II toxin-antitoxin system PemK/MazF family toxin [Stenotrophomonas maltophilia]|uniref:type II toxin-antitoxin system PemK/MazF family toxin n=1 Tax=Stenotrophomonas maltophilia TaxID=40324 RepID=UPI0021C8D3D2|nr:type II toxin-antitoxin system PemK/MazF family toxin [Stenotrophomonas maltophilia]MCU1197522.1 type II toxin-antitoxin system PemK/MazF family toxin [Stenotrophomonas maltophilia]
MGLLYHPRPGEIFMCEFPQEYLHGEMVKKRPVIILNKKMDGRPTLVNVVPISMTPPDIVCAHHVPIGRMSMPKGLRDQEGDRWAKCDMVYTMSIQRLDFVRGHRSNSGARVRDAGALPPATLLAVRLATAKCLGVKAEHFAASKDPAPVLATLAGLPEGSANQDGPPPSQAASPA